MEKKIFDELLHWQYISGLNYLGPDFLVYLWPKATEGLVYSFIKFEHLNLN